MTEAYCGTDDLLIGDIPTPDYLSPQKFVDDAADEIDSKIGFVYETRVNTNAVARPVALLLKRLNSWLASGRLLLSVDAGGEDTQVHAYGLSLIREATATLDLIVKGEILLEGADKVAGFTETSNAPLIYNKDAESQVDAFYDRIANPDYVFTPDYTLPHYGATPESLVRE